jgi:hypothetical protein
MFQKVVGYLLENENQIKHQLDISYRNKNDKMRFLNNILHDTLGIKLVRFSSNGNIQKFKVELNDEVSYLVICNWFAFEYDKFVKFKKITNWKQDTVNSLSECDFNLFDVDSNFKGNYRKIDLNEWVTKKKVVA